MKPQKHKTTSAPKTACLHSTEDTRQKDKQTKTKQLMKERGAVFWFMALLAEDF